MQGIAKSLLDAAENMIKVTNKQTNQYYTISDSEQSDYCITTFHQERQWGFDDLYLLVDSENVAAQKLYLKKGESIYFPL
jgi:ribosomal protein S18 acetylase RimI-like enzyme